MRKIRVALKDVNFKDDEETLSLKEWGNFNTGDIVDADLDEKGSVFITLKTGTAAAMAGDSTYLRHPEFKILED